VHPAALPPAFDVHLLKPIEPEVLQSELLR
jgi:hypothetical protein